MPGGGFPEYVYDSLDRRIQKNANGALTRYVYDGADILLEYDGLNVLLARYTHGPGTDDVVMLERDLDTSGTFDASERFFYQTDGLGSVTELTDSTGAVARSLVYDSYGQIVQDTGGVASPFAFTGRELDSESGLYFYRARYYDPATGRFLSQERAGGLCAVFDGLLGAARLHSFELLCQLGRVDDPRVQPLCRVSEGGECFAIRFCELAHRLTSDCRSRGRMRR